jgi:hypothetical protein
MTDLVVDNPAGLAEDHRGCLAMIDLVVDYGGEQGGQLD